MLIEKVCRTLGAYRLLNYFIHSGLERQEITSQVFTTEISSCSLEVRHIVLIVNIDTYFTIRNHFCSPSCAIQATEM